VPGDRAARRAALLRGGFAFVTVLDTRGDAHLEEVDVDPDFGRRRIGTRLVEAVLGWAHACGHAGVTLTTFRDVAWNAPFYARLGFEVLGESDWTDALRTLREAEREEGLDPQRRVVMRCGVGTADRNFFPHEEGGHIHPERI
jgi:GNAT superfamily N-acetyltransferase